MVKPGYKGLKEVLKQKMVDYAIQGSLKGQSPERAKKVYSPAKVKDSYAGKKIVLHIPNPKKLIAAAVFTLMASASASYGIYAAIKNNLAEQKANVSITQESPESIEHRIEQIAQENSVEIAEQKQIAVNTDNSIANHQKQKSIPGNSLETLAGYITKTYDSWTKTSIPRQTADDYAGWIMKYAKKYNLDPLVLAATISHESRFNNIDGDLKVHGKKTLNYSEGICQIRKLTQVDIKKLMRSKGEDIADGYEDLKQNPELAIRMMAFYLDNLRDKKGSIWSAWAHYNGGNKPNHRYAGKVEKELKLVQNYFERHGLGEVAGNF